MGQGALGSVEHAVVVGVPRGAVVGSVGTHYGSRVAVAVVVIRDVAACWVGVAGGDAVEGAAVGAGAGAIGGAVSGSMKKKEAEKRTQQQREQEQRRIQEEQKQSQQQKAAKAQQAANNQKRQEQALISAIGEDNYRGLIALVDCEHERAEALAKAGAASSNPDHKLSSLLLEALIANDLKQKDRTAELYEQLISADPDIDTEQQASLETDKVLMDVRQERRAQGISCQP